jgi:hypothetical protein
MTWPDVALALIASLPGLFAAYFAYRITQSVKTNSGKTIGQHVETIDEVVASNRQHVGTIESTVLSRDAVVVDASHVGALAYVVHPGPIPGPLPPAQPPPAQ